VRLSRARLKQVGGGAIVDVPFLLKAILAQRHFADCSVVSNEWMVVFRLRRMSRRLVDRRQGCREIELGERIEEELRGRETTV
jgi:hypothetical protein